MILDIQSKKYMTNLQNIIEAACYGLGNTISSAPILSETIKNLYDGVPIEQVFDSAILASRTLIEKDPVIVTKGAKLALLAVADPVVANL